MTSDIVKHTDGDKLYENKGKLGYIWLGDKWVQFGHKGISPKEFQDICIQLEEYKPSYRDALARLDSMAIGEEYKGGAGWGNVELSEEKQKICDQFKSRAKVLRQAIKELKEWKEPE